MRHIMCTDVFQRTYGVTKRPLMCDKTFESIIDAMREFTDYLFFERCVLVRPWTIFCVFDDPRKLGLSHARFVSGLSYEQIEDVEYRVYWLCYRTYRTIRHNFYPGLIAEQLRRWWFVFPRENFL